MRSSTTCARKPGRPSSTVNGRRTCSRCKTNRPVDMFTYSKTRGTRNSWCRQCMAEYGRQWRSRKKRGRKRV